jgi:hypothetical protein
MVEHFYCSPSATIRSTPHAPLRMLTSPPVCNIDEFLSYYRSNFPEATITPKLHMLEDHVVPFIRAWRVGLGMMGEQGAESIHARFNALQRTYSNITNSVQQLKCKVLEHLRQICLSNVARQPPPQKRLKTLPPLKK